MEKILWFLLFVTLTLHSLALNSIASMVSRIYDDINDKHNQ